MKMLFYLRIYLSKLSVIWIHLVAWKWEIWNPWIRKMTIQTIQYVISSSKAHLSSNLSHNLTHQRPMWVFFTITISKIVGLSPQKVVAVKMAVHLKWGCFFWLTVHLARSRITWPKKISETQKCYTFSEQSLNYTICILLWFTLSHWSVWIAHSLISWQTSPSPLISLYPKLHLQE